MGGVKGRAPKSYRDGKLDKYNFRNLSPEERTEIAMKSAETRKKKKNEKMFLQKCMREMLNLRVSSDRQKQILKDMGISDKDLTNKTLLMASLFRKGIIGDVGAIKEIVDMMDKLDMFEDTGKLTNNVVVNLVPEGEAYEPGEKELRDIWKAENGIDSSQSSSGEWEDDIWTSNKDDI